MTWVAVQNMTGAWFSYGWVLGGSLPPGGFGVVDDTSSTVIKGLAVGSLIRLPLNTTTPPTAVAALARADRANAGPVAVVPVRTLEETVASLVAEGAGSAGLQNHIDSPAPHPVYDDLPSLKLIFENGII